MATVGDAIRNNTPQPQFSQTAFVFGVVMFAFVLYVTLRGDLPKWIGLLTKGSGKTSTTSTTDTTGGIGSIGSISAINRGFQSDSAASAPNGTSGSNFLGNAQSDSAASAPSYNIPQLGMSTGQ